MFINILLSKSNIKQNEDHNQHFPQSVIGFYEKKSATHHWKIYTELYYDFFC